MAIPRTNKTTRQHIVDLLYAGLGFTERQKEIAAAISNINKLVPGSLEVVASLPNEQGVRIPDINDSYNSQLPLQARIQRRYFNAKNLGLLLEREGLSQFQRGSIDQSDYPNSLGVQFDAGRGPGRRSKQYTVYLSVKPKPKSR